MTEEVTNQLRSDYTSVATLTDEYFIDEKGRLPIVMTKPGGRDYLNRITIEYTRRDPIDVTATAHAECMVDIDKSGLKEATERLDSLCRFESAFQMAHVLLLKSIWNPERLTFRLGPKSIELKPGDVATISSNTALEISSMDVRILSIHEDENYQMEIEAVQERPIFHEWVPTPPDEPGIPPEHPDIDADAYDVLDAIAIETPAVWSSEGLMKVLVAYNAPDQAAWAGTQLYMDQNLVTGGTGTYSPSPTPNQSFTKGIVGIVTAVGVDGEGVAYIDMRTKFSRHRCR